MNYYFNKLRWKITRANYEMSYDKKNIAFVLPYYLMY